MEKNQENIDINHLTENDGENAYQTLVDWVKSVPRAIQEIEENGTEEDLLRYKKQIKLVVDKLKEIEESLPRPDWLNPIIMEFYFV